MAYQRFAKSHEAYRRAREMIRVATTDAERRDALVAFMPPAISQMDDAIRLNNGPLQDPLASYAINIANTAVDVAIDLWPCYAPLLQWQMDYARTVRNPKVQAAIAETALASVRCLLDLETTNYSHWLVGDGF